MSETTKKKTVAKASAGKQVKASPQKTPEPMTEKSPLKATAKPKPAAVAKPSTAAETPRSNTKQPKVTVSPHRSRDLSPDPDVVARKAYEIYSREGHQHGRDQDHWFRAEEELRNVLV